MTVQSIVLAADVPFPPSVEDFYLPSILPWGEHDNYWFTKITALVWLSAALIIIFFLVAYRKPQLVPTQEAVARREPLRLRAQQHRDRDDRPARCALRAVPGDAVRFILLNNLWGIVPLVQISPNSHIAFPAFLAVISYVMFI